MEPIRRVTHFESKPLSVVKVGEARVRRETPEEATERRQREQREKARRQAARAWADAQLRTLQELQDSLVSEDESDDGRAHVDIRI
jgi:hypothetical protein